MLSKIELGLFIELKGFLITCVVLLGLVEAFQATLLRVCVGYNAKLLDGVLIEPAPGEIGAGTLVCLQCVRIETRHPAHHLIQRCLDVPRCDGACGAVLGHLESETDASSSTSFGKWQMVGAP